VGDYDDELRATRAQRLRAPVHDGNRVDEPEVADVSRVSSTSV
jgi:hypothetical protein